MPSEPTKAQALPQGPTEPPTGGLGGGGQLRPWDRYSKKRLAIALAIAAASDAIGVFVTLAPPMAWGLDAATALLLFIVLGWQWPLLPGLILEAIPGVGIAPIWLLVVVAVAIWGSARPLNLKRLLRPNDDRLTPT